LETSAEEYFPYCETDNLLDGVLLYIGKDINKGTVINVELCNVEIVDDITSTGVSIEF